MNEMVESPFGRAPAASASVSSSLVLTGEAQRAVAEVQAQMMIARANPRDPVKAMDLILQDCMRPGLAESAVYDYSRGGNAISGASIRLAEAIARRWGNISCGIKEVRHEGYSECKAEAWDLETGFYDFRTFHVEHVRDTRDGPKRVRDERDIYEIVANMGQRRKRAVLMTVIPGDVFDSAVKQCETTLKARADISPSGMAKMLEVFAPFGVTREVIEKKIQRRLDAITPMQWVFLQRIYISLRDEMGVPSQWFDMPAPEPAVSQGAAAVKDALKAEKKPEATAPKEERTTPAARKRAALLNKPRPEAGAPSPTAVQPAFDLQAGLTRIAECSDLAVLQLIGDEVELMTEGPEREQMLKALLTRDAELVVPPAPLEEPDPPTSDN